jgi:hypothetical protein
MMVKALRIGSELAGVRVGRRNARRFFPKDITEIELQLDHLRIECGLAPDFWSSQPEIHDPRLSLWLAAKDTRVAACRAPIRYRMTPSGKNSFRIEPAVRAIRQHQRRTTRSFTEIQLEPV